MLDVSLNIDVDSWMLLLQARCLQTEIFHLNFLLPGLVFPNCLLETRLLRKGDLMGYQRWPSLILSHINGQTSDPQLFINQCKLCSSG